jgi:phosphatidylserine/phosphatidylglycerophosphate/cardiolipin synthase-like enzyme
VKLGANSQTVRLSSFLFLVVLFCGACGGLAIDPDGGATGGGFATGGGLTTGGGLASGGGFAQGGGTASGGGAAAGGGGTHPGGGTATGGGTTTGGGTAAPGVTIIVEPSDNGVALHEAMIAAHTSIHMTMYLLSSNVVITDLIAAKHAGREVKVLLNQYFTGTTANNDAVFTQLQTAGVNVKWAPSTFTLTHEKCIILDQATAWIMTMNAASTPPTSNREYLAVDTVPADVAEAEAIFQTDFGAPATVTGSLVVSPTNSRTKLVALISAATSTIDLEAEEFSDSAITSALVAARGRHVQVRLVLADNAPSSAQSAAVSQLKAAGASLVTLNFPYVHAKSMVVDAQRAYVGSENFTSNSLTSNRELGVVVTAPAEVQKIMSTTATDFANGTAI